MCDPVSAVAVGSVVAGFVGQQMQAADQADSFNQRAAINLTNAEKSQSIQIDALNAREIEAQRQDAQQLLDAGLRSRAAQGTAVAAAAAGGVEGNSVAGLLNNFRRTESRFKVAVGTNAESRRAQNERNRKAINSQGQARVDALQPPVLNSPDFVGAALRIGTAVGGSFIEDSSRFDGITNLFDSTNVLDIPNAPISGGIS